MRRKIRLMRAGGWTRLLCGTVVLAGGLALAVVAPSARADQNDPRLPALFDVLRATKDPIQAHVTEQGIWRIWMASPDDTVNLLMLRGMDAMSSRDFGTALKVFTQMVEIAPDFAEGWNKRATVLYMLGAYAESIADIGRVLELEPRHFGALSGLGLCNAELQRDEAALDAFERALAVNPHMEGARAHAEMIRRRIEDKAI